MDMNRMTIKLQEALQAASAQATRRSHQSIDVEHMLLALLEQEGGLAGPLLEQAGVSQASVRKAAEQALAKVPQVQGPGVGPGQIHLTARFSQVLARAEQEMQA
ncbi:MAG: Clp protease N-terminal domain-containing protein, partial [Nitrospiraceae bacterium]